MFCCIGIYSIIAQVTDVLFIGLFGLAGFVLIRCGFEPAPTLLGFVLGKLMEENLRRALILPRGQLTTLVTEPISAGLLAVSLILLIIAVVTNIRRGVTRSSRNRSRSVQSSKK